jgi:hypothetical protein
LTTEATIEKAFRRLMRMRIRLGMFDPPTLLAYNKLAERDLQTAASTALNRRSASSGMVLLRNSATARARDSATARASDPSGAGASKTATAAVVAAAVAATPAALLPLKLSQFVGKEGSILVAGATANNGNNTFGNYACDNGNCSTNVTSVLGGLRNAQTGLNRHGEVVYEPGCLSTNCSEGADSDSFAAAVAVAQKAMVTVLVLGTLGWDKVGLLIDWINGQGESMYSMYRLDCLLIDCRLLMAGW